MVITSLRRMEEVTFESNIFFLFFSLLSFRIIIISKNPRKPKNNPTTTHPPLITNRGVKCSATYKNCVQESACTRWEGSCWVMSYICKRRLPRQPLWGTDKGMYFWSQTQLYFIYVVQTFFHGCIHLPIANDILLIHKMNCRCLGGTRSPTLCWFLPFFSIFPVRKWFCV